MSEIISPCAGKLCVIKYSESILKLREVWLIICLTLLSLANKVCLRIASISCLNSLAITSTISSVTSTNTKIRLQFALLSFGDWSYLMPCMWFFSVAKLARLKSYSCDGSICIMGCLTLKGPLQWKCIFMALFISLHGHMAKNRVKPKKTRPPSLFPTLNTACPLKMRWLVMYYQCYLVLMLHHHHSVWVQSDKFFTTSVMVSCW